MPEQPPVRESTIRAFIAIPLADQAREILKQHVLPAKKTLKDKNIRWVPPANYHVTLAFLGSVPEAGQEDIEAVIEKVCHGREVFNVHVNAARPFPSERKARLFAAEITPSDPLSRLQAALRCALDAHGYKMEDKRFRPHVTLARLKRPMALSGAVGDAGFPIALAVNRVCLYKSETHQTGAVYTCLRDVVFRVN
ncbi:RNA 2',3'-cyclic phosphodiesterase [Luteithermobacter gelatinilyticus]|uniref:RNA 2',3'-cyclic phosphodiesterase n=1 Tax=Luteithermobacter gelatinilyticus TaxID=2582913 RepID=UPI0011064BB9|nr:RNA 2',3'-cyclic phosphodiesterase [Luteithermobacter gelatinilyticus]|tara:strand:- start:12620 stop:13204 length:585 start_codon:yes stop_codon:yes gene_type:complete